MATFLTSAADARGLLSPGKPLIAVCGKSNVGKSSFINLLAGQKGLARTSAEPGRTRLVNYFDFGAFALADLPGYGYARVSQAEKARWAALLDAFFAKGNVAHVFSLLDIRHEPTSDDKLMVEYLYRTRTPFTAVATKADKLGKTRLKEAARRLAAACGTGEGNVIPVSAVNGRGREEVLARIAQVCAAPCAPAEEENDTGEDT